MTQQEIQNITLESLRDWFKKEKWVRITTSGNIAGPCGTSKNKKNPDRCLPAAKARSLTKAQRAATARKKKKAGAKGKTVVKNTKKATVTNEGKEVFTNIHGEDMTMLYKPETEQIFIQHDDINTDFIELDKFLKRFILSKEEQNAIISFYKKHIKDHKLPEGLNKETKEAPAGHYFTKSGNLVKGRMSADAKERGARKSDPKDKQRSKVPKATQQAETANPQDGKAAPYGSGYKKLTKEDLRNLVVGTIAELQQKEDVLQEDDRCTRLAKSKYDTWPSAYASGAVVRCRRGEIWKEFSADPNAFSLNEGPGKDYLDKAARAYFQAKDFDDADPKPNPNDVALYISETDTDDIDEHTLKDFIKKGNYKEVQVAEYQFDENKYDFSKAAGAGEYDSSIIIFKVVDKSGKHILIPGDSGKKSYPYLSTTDRGILGDTYPLLEAEHVKILKSIADIFQPTDVYENYADGKVKGKSRPGRVKKSGASCKGSVASLRAKAKKYGGEKGKMYHWCANMKSGKK